MSEQDKYFDEIVSFIGSKKGEAPLNQQIWVCEILRLASHALFWSSENKGNALALALDLITRSYDEVSNEQ